MKKLLILGAGGYGKTVADVAAQLGYDEIRFLDDSRAGESILGKCEDYVKYVDRNTDIYPAFGHNWNRMKWLGIFREKKLSIPTLIHPRAYVSPTAKIGIGTVVLPMAVVNTGVTVNEGCIINIGALIDHDSVVEAGCHLAPGAVVKAENRIRAGSRIESGIVIQNREYPL